MKIKHILPFLFLTSILCSPFRGYSQEKPLSDTSMYINNFVIKENLLKNSKIAIIASDENEKPLEKISGTYQFTINGFKQELKFNEGVAIAPQQIDKSTFIYLRHENEAGTHGKLYYVTKKDDTLKPMKINWTVLILIPVVLIILATMFRKFILIAVVIIAAILYFNSSNGLSMPTFMETVFDGLKGLV